MMHSTNSSDPNFFLGVDISRELKAFWPVWYVQYQNPFSTPKNRAFAYSMELIMMSSLITFSFFMIKFKTTPIVSTVISNHTSTDTLKLNQ